MLYVSVKKCVTCDVYDVMGTAVLEVEKGAGSTQPPLDNFRDYLLF